MDFVDPQRPALALGGDGAVDITTIDAPGPGSIGPRERYKWSVADSGGLIDEQVLATGINASPDGTDIVAVTKHRVNGVVTLYLISSVNLPTGAADGTPQQFGGVLDEDVLEFTPVSLSVVDVDELWLFAEDGRCTGYRIATGLEILAKRCASN
jgi:hypothetical protein